MGSEDGWEDNEDVSSGALRAGGRGILCEDMLFDHLRVNFGTKKKDG